MKKTLAVLVASGLTLAISSCSKPSPQEQVMKAYQDQQTQSEMAATVSFNGDFDVLNQLAAEDAKKSGTTFSPDVDFKQLANVKMSTHAKTTDGSPLSKVTDMSKVDMAFITTFENVKVLDFLFAGQKPYLRSDFANLKSVKDSKEIQAVFKSINDGSIPWAKKFIAGGWVSMDKAFIDKIMKNSDAPQKADSNKSQQFNTLTEKNLMTNTTFTQVDDHVKASLKLKPFLNQLATDAKAVGEPNFTAKTTEDIQKSATQIKDDAVVNADLWIEDGKMKKMSVNLFQVANVVDKSKLDGDTTWIDKLSPKTLNMVITMDEGKTDLTAPKDAVELKDNDLMGLFMMLATSGDSSTGGMEGSSTPYQSLDPVKKETMPRPIK